MEREVHATLVGIVSNFPQLIFVFLFDIIVPGIAKGNEAVGDSKSQNIPLVIFFEEQLEIQ